MKTTLDVDINQIDYKFDQLLIANNSTTEMRVRKIIATELCKARDSVRKDAHSILKNDPREAYKAVSYAVYKKILGGNVNIMNHKKASGMVKKESRRGANSQTLRIDSYRGVDRAFILRWTNQGTVDRVAETMNNEKIRIKDTEDRKRRKGGYKSSIIGFRGSISTPFQWFSKSSAQAMNIACKSLAETIEEMVQEQFGA